MTDSTPRTIVTFRSSAFNTTERREYFINPECYGDDVARWLLAGLRERGIEGDEEPGQEDFGWYLTFRVEAVDHQLVIGYQAGDDGEEGQWNAWLERRAGLLVSLLGGRKRGILPGAARAVHEVLSTAPEIYDVRWHTERDLKAGREDGSAEP